MAITPAGVAPKPVTTTTTNQTTTAQTTTQPQTTTNAQPVPNSTFNAGGQNGPVAGVGGIGNVPAPPPPAAVPTPWGEGYNRGNIYDAQSYLTDKLKISGNGTLRLFHHTDTLWGVPGVKRKMTISQNKGQTGQLYGPGFYTSTKPETGYGKYEFQVELPFKAFAGKKIYESQDGTVMPPGVDILAVPQYDGKVWFIFKSESEQWLNASAMEADFDAPGEAVGWS